MSQSQQMRYKKMKSTREQTILRIIKRPTQEALLGLIRNEEYHNDIKRLAGEVRDRSYGHRVYLRGLIEISSYCKNNCYYCGIRSANANALRYRLNREQILGCCRTGASLGFSTFVLQGGEDPWYTDERLCGIIRSIKAEYPGCAVTLSLGERSGESYRLLYEAGADRYLLRHETATPAHYARLHPPALSLRNRMQCLTSLKEIGYQTGAGFMVGSPCQSLEHLAADLKYISELAPQMVGIGPFLPHHESPFADFASDPSMATEVQDPLNMTILMVALTRLLLPYALIPATTALATLSPQGREKALDAGANVIMPNLSPEDVRGAYLLYDNKASFGTEAAESLEKNRQALEKSGYIMDMSRGDYKQNDIEACLKPE
nr:[FeFe] hydrogenase H-cluster radical SAM maturase HydE [Diplocloster modestus]